MKGPSVRGIGPSQLGRNGSNQHVAAGRFLEYKATVATVGGFPSIFLRPWTRVRRGL